MLCFDFSVCYFCYVCFVFFFFFKQKTAYEMRISDWSSDVCSSDLTKRATEREPGLPIGEATLQRGVAALPDRRPLDRERGFDHQCGRGVPGGVERQLSAHLPHMRVPTWQRDGHIVLGKRRGTIEPVDRALTRELEQIGRAHV